MEILINAQLKKAQDGGFRYGNRESAYGVNTLYFTKDGKPFLPVAGELHFSRVPHKAWRKELLKMQDMGVTVVSTYVFWNYHEEKRNDFDFCGDKDVGAFLALCRELHMPCILRVGPWCHGEAVRGGFPRRIHFMPGKRTNRPAYLNAVEHFFRGLFNEVEPYLDGETVLGMQLENEYTGSIEHIRTLRRMVERIGFKVPFFTMTAWPTNRPDPEFLPMVGGYPEAPWTQHKRPLAPNNRFAIQESRSEAQIGEDLMKSKKAGAAAFDAVPFASCETGPGNQVTQHRRPIIHEKDGYGVGFAKFASGCNFLGYYMLRGGRNPNDALMQESRITGYPNNYPIIDYDFQAPLSRYGECRPHGDRLRLMHLFISQFDREIATKQAYFPTFRQVGMGDRSFPKCSVRINEGLSGYFFVSTYERSFPYRDFQDVSVTVACGNERVTLPTISIKAGSLFFYPFRLHEDGVLFDYILAQPLVRHETEDCIRLYFAECEGISPVFCINGNVRGLTPDRVAPAAQGETKRIEFLVLSDRQARRFHWVGDRPVFADGTVYCDQGTVVCETTEGSLQCGERSVSAQPVDVANQISFHPCRPVPLPYGYYLYSFGKRRYYKLTMPPGLLEQAEDIRLCFTFDGLNLQVFSGKTLINDYFNTDGMFVMYLREYTSYLRRNPVLVFKTAAPTSFGVGRVYNEIGLKPGQASLQLREARLVHRLEVNGKRISIGK